MFTGPGIREAVAQDVDGIRWVQRAGGHDPLDRGELVAAIEDPDRLVLVATSRDMVVGWAKTHWYPTDDDIAPAGHYLGGIGVEPGRRRHGVGAALTQARLAWVFRRGDAAYVFIDAKNIDSLALHQRLGFEVIGHALRIRDVAFTGGVGVLLRMRRPGADAPAPVPETVGSSGR